MTKVSVIVPVFNAAPYLRRCLDSLLAQTLKEVEIICVDDGSTDGSGDILDAFAGRDARLRVVHRPHAGAGAARNAGLGLATGEYLFRRFGTSCSRGPLSRSAAFAFRRSYIRTTSFSPWPHWRRPIGS